MIKEFSVKTFKSLEDVTVELGQVNVFVGANGSGKSNLLEALGILSAAADGKVDDQALLARGVRLGTPRLYKSAFPAQSGGERISSHLSFAACSGSQIGSTRNDAADLPDAEYKVCLWNNLQDPDPAWTFKTESWNEKGNPLASRSPASKGKSNEERDLRNRQRGFAALRAVEVANGPALSLLESLQGYVIFSPITAVLRGVAPETQPRTPVGLSGGNLLPAIHNLLIQQRRGDKNIQKICQDVLDLIDWAREIELTSAAQQPFSPAKSSVKTSIRFRDRFMRKGRDLLSAYEAAEGALYALFLAVIAGHKDSPRLCAVDNADHGLNPRLARTLMERLCQWYMDMEEPRQILLTTHNPLILDGLLLQDDRVRLFTVSRTHSGRTSVRRVVVDADLLEKAKRGWSLSRLWVMGHLGGVPNV